MIDKVQENRVRRLAQRLRLTLRKSPRRDPRAPDFERFMLMSMDKPDQVVFGGSPHDFSATLAEVEEFLGYKAVPDTSPSDPNEQTLQELLASWFAEKPERMAQSFGLGAEGTDGDASPEDAARFLVAGRDFHFNVADPAAHILKAVEALATEDPSPTGDAMITLLRRIAGTPVTGRQRPSKP